MSTYRDNDPNYNVRKLVKFDDFSKEKEVKDLEDFKRGFVKNSDNHKIVRNTKYRYNKTTQKMDDLSIEEVDDKIKSLKESNGSARLEIMELLSKYLEENPSIRFAQALFNLGIIEFEDPINPAKKGFLMSDIHNDSDEDILNGMNKNY